MFTTDIRHISGQDIVADAPSRVEAVAAPPTHAIAAAQSGDATLQRLLSDTALNLTKFQVPGTLAELYCDISTGKTRPYIRFSSAAGISISPLA